MIYDWILSNKELLKIVYALIICFICAIIALKSDRLFKLSDYQGIRYLRNAFVFYGIAFFIRFILGAIRLPSPNYQILISLVFKFSIIMAGFFLLYSLTWKKIEKQSNYSSVFNMRMAILYLITILIVVLDFFWTTDLFMYSSQIILFAIMSIIAYRNYIKGGRKHKFLKFYFLTMILGFVAWILNTALYYFLDYNKSVQMQVYGLNIVFFLLFLYGIIKSTKKNG